MPDQGLFVDFMYAVTVGATLPRIDETVLHISSPVLWGIFFLIAVFLEDFYLYHVKVVPQLTGLPSWRGFILAMLIIGTWYLSQAAFPSNVPLFLATFATFFLLKLLGGVLMRLTPYPARQDTVFLIPAIAALVLIILRKHVLFAGHPGRLLMLLAPLWLISVSTWWIMDRAAQATIAHP